MFVSKCCKCFSLNLRLSTKVVRIFIRYSLPIIAASAMSCPGYAQDIWRGVDLSYVNELEDCGAVYRYEGEVAGPYAILPAREPTLFVFGSGTPRIGLNTALCLT